MQILKRKKTRNWRKNISNIKFDEKKNVIDKLYEP